ncbi:hypothetical protein JYK00_06980 [Thermosipho ferrireducens]|uniref:Uncharacterized protein n=2 Tax=Thermosipho ferrireducens TaxID=2571116 RepID=A0ABX7SBL2_9BACT|nr:hypothetical protein JYK00_06980 [Thermosipho ferrireducens]
MNFFVIFAVNFSLEYTQNVLTLSTDTVFSNAFQVGIEYSARDFQFWATMYLSNDNKYPPFYPGYYGNYYFIMKDSGVEFSLNNNMNIKIGNFSNYDVINSPYSLYLSSLGHSAPTVSFKYQDDKFIYETRWILVSYESSPLLDKGMNFKYYAMKLGNVVVGYEEASVYVNRIFDVDYFINPLPSFFVQYIREWGPFSEGWNDNSMMGFFIKYETLDKYLYAQMLVDDFNANRFFNPDNPTVDKIAWSLGGKFDFGIFSVGVYHAGATKYVFQPSDTKNEPLYYGYTYYTETLYTKYGQEYIIDYLDNYIGYKYGENNLAFLGQFSMNFPFLNLYSDVEYVISGTKSPVNPWTESDTYTPGFNLLNDPLLEKSLFFRTKLEKYFDFVSVGVNFVSGIIWNKLELVEANDSTKKPYFSPSNKTEQIFDLSLFFKFQFSL